MRVTRYTTFRTDRLSAAARAALAPKLVDIVQTWFLKSDRAFIADHVIFREHGCLTVLYGKDDRVLGFISSGITQVEAAGRRWAVMDAGIYTRVGTTGSGRIARNLGLRQMAAYKLRHPRTPFVFIGQTAGPVTYIRTADLWPVIHPRPDVPIPSDVTALVRAVMPTRGMPPVADDPWIVALADGPVSLRRPERLTASSELDAHPDVAWYRARNPEHPRGEWLVVYVSMRWHHILAAPFPPLRRLFSNRAR